MDTTRCDREARINCGQNTHTPNQCAGEADGRATTAVTPVCLPPPSFRSRVRLLASLAAPLVSAARVVSTESHDSATECYHLSILRLLPSPIASNSSACSSIRNASRIHRSRSRSLDSHTVSQVHSIPSNVHATTANHHANHRAGPSCWSVRALLPERSKKHSLPWVPLRMRATVE
jgi:hypothetical protein